MTFVAFGTEGNFLGTVPLIENDFESRSQLSPWRASLYVRPESRGNGIGSMLVKKIISKASDAGRPNIYLYTESAERYYTGMGWTIRGKLLLHGMNVTVMEYAIRK